MTDLMELASRVEAGEGPDRELDAAIWLHLPEQEGHAWKHGGDRYKHAHQIAGCSFVPAYTASTDAAMTLIGDDCWRVEDHPLAGPCALVGDAEGYAATPALALTAAALRARAHQGAAHVDQ